MCKCTYGVDWSTSSTLCYFHGLALQFLRSLLPDLLPTLGSCFLLQPYLHMQGKDSSSFSNGSGSSSPGSISAVEQQLGVKPEEMMQRLMARPDLLEKVQDPKVGETAKMRLPHSLHSSLYTRCIGVQ